MGGGQPKKAYDTLTATIMPNRLSDNLMNTPLRGIREYTIFQIDANFGYTAALAEMLLQSHEGDIHLLPALPDEWPTGSIKGLRARGNFVVDMEWNDGTLHHATVTSVNGNPCTVRYGGREISFETKMNATYIFDGNLQR